MKKFIFIDVDGKEKEALAYEISDFTAIPSPNAPVLTSPEGTLNPLLLPPIIYTKSATLVIQRVCGEDIPLGSLVSASVAVPGQVLISSPTSDANLATVLGLALQSKLQGEVVEVLVMGIFASPSFASFPVNAQLFLEVGGLITGDRPTAPSRNYLTNVGKSLGSGEVLINPSNPIKLGG